MSLSYSSFPSISLALTIPSQPVLLHLLAPLPFHWSATGFSSSSIGQLLAPLPQPLVNYCLLFPIHWLTSGFSSHSLVSYWILFPSHWSAPSSSSPATGDLLHRLLQLLILWMHFCKWIVFSLPAQCFLGWCLHGRPILPTSRSSFAPAPLVEISMLSSLTCRTAP